MIVCFIVAIIKLRSLCQDRLLGGANPFPPSNPTHKGLTVRRNDTFNQTNLSLHIKYDIITCENTKVNNFKFKDFLGKVVDNFILSPIALSDSLLLIAIEYY